MTGHTTKPRISQLSPHAACVKSAGRAGPAAAAIAAGLGTVVREITIAAEPKKGEGMEFIRPVDWDRSHVTLDGGYQGQYLYAGESCLIIVTRVPPGAAGPPRHRHPSDQTYFVVQGEMTVELGEQTRVVKPRSAVFIPAGLPHRNWNDGAEDEIHVEVIAPGVLLVQRLVEAGELRDTSAQLAFVREADPSRLTGRDFGLDWLVDRASGATHATVYLAEVPPGKTGPPLHVHEFDPFYFVLQGTLSVEIGLQGCDVPPGRLVVLPAQVPARPARRLVRLPDAGGACRGQARRGPPPSRRHPLRLDRGGRRRRSLLLPGPFPRRPRRVRQPPRDLPRLRRARPVPRAHGRPDPERQRLRHVPAAPAL
jgi:mannose-6-phosphate isomerase-like protein (cupin superfamily)